MNMFNNNETRNEKPYLNYNYVTGETHRSLCNYDVYL